MCKTWMFAACLLLLLEKGLTGNILFVMPAPVYSHIVPFTPILQELTHRGHNITYISSFKHDSLPTGVTQIKLNLTMSDFEAAIARSGMTDFRGFGYETLGFMAFAEEVSRMLLPPILQVLPSPSSITFDLIIVEFFFGQISVPRSTVPRMYRAWICTVCLLLLFKPGLSGNVLILMPMPSYSHVIPFMPILEELASRGHNVTYISSFKYDSLPKGVTQIKLDLKMSQFGAAMAKRGFMGQGSFSGFNYKALGSTTFADEMCRLMLPPILKNLPPPSSNKFDLIIAEIFFAQEVLAVLGHIYNAPVVAKHPGPVTPIVAHILGNPNIDSYTPNVRLKMSENMSFFERTVNFLVSKIEVGYYLGFTLPRMEAVMREFFPDVPNLPPLIDMLRNTSLLMTETHFAANYQRPLHRNIIEIGGMGVKVLPPLPQDLEKILNESESGVIYFSLGSQFKEASTDQTLFDALMDTFSKLKQKVFIKWSNSSISGVPDNVVLRSWFPQNSILSHKNVVLYISHGGLNSIYEAVYYGIPVVGTPILVDQPHNINILRHFGMAEYVEFDSIGDRVTLLNAINKVLSNPSYRENAKKRSGMLRDRPIPLHEEVVYWLEYIMKYGGDVFRPASVLIPWYIMVQLDIILFLTSIILTILLIPVFIVRKCRRQRIKIEHKKKVQ